MEVRKHYVSDGATKNDATYNSAKFTKKFMSQATDTDGSKINGRTKPTKVP